ncbi:hypothetical protein ACHAXS_011944 [Conticribra weissflogii]
MGWKEKTDRAKKLHRPSLKNWARDGLHATFPAYASSLLHPSAHPYSSFRIVGGNEGEGEAVESSLSLEDAREVALERDVGRRKEGQRLGCRRHLRDGDLLAAGCFGGGVEFPAVLDARVTSPREFHEEYEARCVPCVIRNIPNGGGAERERREAEAEAEAGGSDDDGDGRANDGGFGEEKKEESLERPRRGDDSPVRAESYRPLPDVDHIAKNIANDATSPIAKNRPWPALRNWTLSSLSNSPHLRDRPLKCGEDDDGYTLRVKLKHFLKYLSSNTDDSPLYIFDATFDEDRFAKRLLEDYTVPDYFDEDLFGLVGERRRPPYRWFLVGPERSGTTVHVDPLGTSAWNTLVVGVKRWVLFPPHVPKSVVKGRKLTLPGEDDEAIHYFTTILPRMKRRAAACRGRGDYADFECYEFTQYAGETVYVPHGWWHAVLNVTHTVGITQNFCSRRNFDVVWRETRGGRKKMACSWLRRLKDRYPDLARRAEELNRRDGFVMWEDDEEEQRKWRRKRMEKERRRREKEKRKETKGVTVERERGKEEEAEVDRERNTTGSCGRESKRSRVGNAREVSPE